MAIIDAILGGVNINAKTKDGYTALLLAASDGDTMMIRHLLAHGADIDAVDSKGRNVLFRVSRHEIDKRIREKCAQYPLNHYESMKYLVEHGARINISDNEGNTPLHNVLSFGITAEIEYLVEHCANIHASNKFGQTPLNIAVSKSSLDAVRCFVENGADVNAKGHFGNTCLHEAAKHGAWDTLKYLVECGADVNVKNEEGETPLLLAAYYSWDWPAWDPYNKQHEQAKYTTKWSIVFFLIDNGAEVNVVQDSNAYGGDSRQYFGWTVLDYAVYVNAEDDVIKRLVERGAVLARYDEDEIDAVKKARRQVKCKRPVTRHYVLAS